MDIIKDNKEKEEDEKYKYYYRYYWIFFFIFRNNDSEEFLDYLELKELLNNVNIEKFNYIL